MKNARNQHRTDYAKELIKIVQTTKDREELKKKIAAYHERDIANAIVESDKTVRKCIYDILDIADIAEIFSYIEEEPGKYLEEMPIEQAAKVVSNMDSDDAMDLFEELNEEDKYKLLKRLDKEVRSGLLHFFIKPIRPPLHHFSALIEILSVVVNSANPVC